MGEQFSGMAWEIGVCKLPIFTRFYIFIPILAWKLDCMKEKLVLDQNRGHHIRKYQILDEGLKAELKIDNTYQSYTIKFDDIAFDEIVVDRKPNPIEVGLFVSVFFNLIFAVILISEWIERMQIGTIVISTALFGVLSGMSVWGYTLFQFYREKILKGKQNTFLFYAKKDEQEVDSFITLLKEKQAQYFRALFMHFDDTIDLWAYEGRLKWLLEKKFIDKEEFKSLQAEIENRRLMGG